MKLVFDRIGMPQGDMPLDAKVIATRGYKVDKEGDIRGKGHAKRDIVEWMLPPLWPWKIIMLPARGPRPTLKGESHALAAPDGRRADPAGLRQQRPELAFLRASGEWRMIPSIRILSASCHGLPRRQLPKCDGFNSVWQRRSRHGGRRLAAERAADGCRNLAVRLCKLRFEVRARRSAAPGVPVFVLKSGMVLSVAITPIRTAASATNWPVAATA